MASLIPTIVSLTAGLLIGIIGYFLKRTMSRVDKTEESLTALITNIKDTFVTDKVTNELKADIKQIREDYTPTSVHDKAYDECRLDIKEIKEDYITKEDFFREQSKLERKIDKIMDILMEMKGAK